MKSSRALNECANKTVFGVPVTCCSIDYALHQIDANIRGLRKRAYICITNTESMYYAKRIPEHLEYIKNATFSFCDGIGIVIAAKAAGNNVWRLNGPDFVEYCCRYGLKSNWRHFFCGGKNGVADLLSQKLTRRFPGIIIAGTFCPPFRQLKPEEEEEMVRQINEAKPDILWVGLGLLKQERWVIKYIDRINVPWMIGVGAAFDYHAETVRWAPVWIRRIGMEWLYRLCFEPRMFVRNARSSVFMFQAIGYGLIQRLFYKAR